MSQQEINPIESCESEELSEAELDALAGGNAHLLQNNLSSVDLFHANASIVKTSDGMYSPVDPGANNHVIYTPMNLSLTFP